VEDRHVAGVEPALRVRRRARPGNSARSPMARALAARRVWPSRGRTSAGSSSETQRISTPKAGAPAWT
jgi:hypothetical protein